MQRQTIHMNPADQAPTAILDSDELLGAVVTLYGVAGRIAGMRRVGQAGDIEVIVLRPGKSAEWVCLTSASLLF